MSWSDAEKSQKQLLRATFFSSLVKKIKNYSQKTKGKKE